jgi:hypothetical protein
MCVNIVQDRIKKSFDIIGKKFSKIFKNKIQSNEESLKDLQSERVFNLSTNDFSREKNKKKIEFYLYSKNN